MCAGPNPSGALTAEVVKITKIEVIHLRKDLHTGMRISRGGFRVREHALVRITCEDGTTGLGEGVGHAQRVVALLKAGLAQKVLGRRIDQIESLKRSLLEDEVYFERCGSAVCAISALEMACWDALGRKLGVPASVLLGTPVQDSIRAYASDIYWLEKPDLLGRRAAELVEKGFQCVKAHLGCEEPKRDAARVAAIRRAAGSDVGVMIDLNAGYSRNQAREAVQRWAEYQLLWLEEPFHPDDLDGLAELRHFSPIPLAAGENWFTRKDFLRPIELGCVDYLMPDAGRVGGLGELRAIAGMAEAHRQTVSPHNFSSGILLGATLQVMATLPNAEWLEMDGSENAIYNELLEEPLKNLDGRIQVPEYPGFGTRLPEEIIRVSATELCFEVSL